MSSATIEELKKVIALSDLPEEHLRWILDHSQYREFEEGEVVMKAGAPTENLHLMVEGSVDFYLDVNGKQVYYYTFANDKTTGGASGLLPYSRMKTSPGYAYATSKVRMLLFAQISFS